MTENWKEDELRASVVAYIDMNKKDSNGERFVKKHYYIDLAKRFGRTEKSYEFRMQNISYVFSLLGRSWVSGLKPAKNVGSRNAGIIENLIAEIEGQAPLGIVPFEAEVLSLRQRKNLEKPIGVNEPSKLHSSQAVYSRDPAVKAWVLKESKGKCECCDCSAPFVTAAGNPYLEVHHIRQLADGGEDTIANTVALCPNCHRELHYGVNRLEKINLVYSKISRLIR
ncbi:MAG: HNH endonuclease [Alteromonadaceae bacterium]|nr:MAG: HNH endonuclease [Alteromonadaceae bacterium]